MTSRLEWGAAAAVLLTILLAPPPLWGQEEGPVGERLEVTVDSVVVTGNRRISDEEVRARSQLQPGTRVQYPDVQAAIRRLFATGDFENVQIHVGGSDPAVFYIQVEERPYVFEFAFEGLRHVDPQAVRDTAGLPAEGPLDPARVTRALSAIEDRLARSGFPRAEVDTTIRPAGDELPGYRLTFHVREGPRLGIARIEFEGNDAFSDDRLQSAMSSGEEGFLWWNSGELRRDRYEADLTERLPDFYASHGYLDFAVVDDTVIVDSRTGKGKIVIRVQEGEQYRLTDFRVQGNRRFPTTELLSFYGAPADPDSVEGMPVFNRVEFESSAREVEDQYRNAGYLRAAVQPHFERIRTESDPPRVRAVWQIREGEPAYIRQIQIVGNTHTHDRIIRDRLSILPGDVYSQQRLINSVQRVQGMGFFEQLPPQEAIEISQTQEGDVNITLRVKEQSTGNVNFGMSAAAITGLAGFIGYQQPNLFGQAKNVNFRWVFGSRTNDIEVAYQDPEIFGTDKTARISLRRSRDEFRTFSIGTRRQTGGSLEIGTPLMDRWTQLFVGYSLFNDKLTDLDLTDEQRGRAFLQQGTRSSSSVRLVRDTRNSPLFPTAGSRNSLSFRFTGGPLGGDGEFGKLQLESEWFTPVAQIGGGMQSVPITFTAGISFNGGLVVGDNPFFRERFFLGGVQFGEQLRGYDEATVTPSGHVPRRANFQGFSQLERPGEAFFTTSAQVGVKLTSNLFFNSFVDAGNVWERASAFNPTDLLTGAGVGVSLVTPFGPLGIDYAYGFDRRDVLGRPDPGWKLHFKFGRIF